MLEEPLINHSEIELNEKRNDNNVTETKLLLLLQQNEQIINSIQCMNQLMPLLGGMNEVLRFYLNEKGLTQIQMESVHNILIECNNQQYEVSVPSQNILNANSNHTMLHKIVGIVWANKLIKLMTNKISSIIMVFNSCLCWFMPVLVPSVPNILWFILSTFSWLVSLIYFCLIICGTNIQIMKRLITRFEWWFKMFYALQCSFWFTVLNIARNVNTYNVILSIEFSSIYALIIIIFCNLDGLNIALWWKVLFGLLFNVLLTLNVIVLTYENFKGMHFQSDGFKLFGIFSVYPIQRGLDVMKVLCIFLWKQVILLIWYKNKSATTIKNNCSIAWDNE
eukprot:378096_1